MSPLGQVAVFLGATVIAVPLFRRLGLSAILGYLIAGIAIGPWGLEAIADPAASGVTHVGELGVVLLLFVIGLELQLSRLRVMRRAVFGLGFAQMALTTLVFAALGRVLHLPWPAALVVGFACSLSSTPLALQLLAERGQLTTQHGRSAFGILLFQDLAVMPVLALLPLLGAAGAAPNLGGALLAVLKVAVVFVAVVAGGRYLLRPALHAVAATRVREAFTAVALLVVIGTALIFSVLGLSMALGAFVAGVLLADSEYRHELEADIEPFKGLLLGLFFMSVGMTVNLGLVAEHPGRILALVSGLLAVKFVLLWLLGYATHRSAESARGLAFALPQAGEFGFVLLSLAVSATVLDPALAATLIIVITLSMILTPLLMQLQSRVIEPRLRQKPQRPFDDPGEARQRRVIIAGFGRFGQIVARVLRARRFSFTALDASVEQVDFVRRFGNEVYYGDASRLDLLQAAGAADADLFVLAIDDIEASVRTAEMVSKHFPELRIFARARNRQHALRLMDIGVHYVIRETYLSSLDLARNALEALGLSRAIASESIRRFQQHDGKTLESQLRVRDDEQQLIQTSALAAKELERLFDADTETETETVPPEPARR